MTNHMGGLSARKEKKKGEASHENWKIRLTIINLRFNILNHNHLPVEIDTSQRNIRAMREPNAQLNIKVDHIICTYNLKD